MISFLEISRKCKLTMSDRKINDFLGTEGREKRRRDFKEIMRSDAYVHCLCFDDSFMSVLVCLVKSLSRVRLFSTPWTATRQASLSITNFLSLLKLMSIELVMPFNHLILCHLLLLLPSIFPSIPVFSNESVLRIRWPKYWSFSFSISASNEYSGLISFRIDQFDLLAV